METCPNCGSHEIEVASSEVVGIETTYFVCLECDETFGGDLE